MKVISTVWYTAHGTKLL